MTSVKIADVIRYDHYDLRSIPQSDAVWTEGPVLVVRSAFHGGGVVSRHRTVRAAWRRLRSLRLTECVCGCAGIIDAADHDALPTVECARGAYDLAR